MNEREVGGQNAVSRRRILRATLGTGAVAAAWSAPHIKSLVITPEYAAAATMPVGSVSGVQVVPVIAAGGRACNNANEEVFAIAGLPGATFTIINKLCQSGFEFDWSISPTTCTVTGMYCTQAQATAGTPFTPGFVEGTSQVGVNTCFPETAGGLWIDVTCS